MGLASQMFDDWVQQHVVLDNITPANLLVEDVGDLTAAHCSVGKSIIPMPCLEDIRVSIKGTHGQSDLTTGFSQMLHVIGIFDSQGANDLVEIGVSLWACTAAMQKLKGHWAGTSGRIRRSLLFRPNGYQRAYQ